jgi:hypothetical protein
MEVCEADDVVGGGFGSSPLPGIIHSGCTAFITRQRSPTSTSHDVILSEKLEHPHGSIEKGEKALQRRWRRQWRLRGEILISLSLLLAEADGKHEREEDKK